jgi:mono/diheme cytochrome c family protein
MIIASTYSSIGIILAVLVLVGVLVYAAINFSSGRGEVGSELELAANRKPYLPDEELEGKKLDKSLTWSLLLLIVIGVGLPLYWLNEPSRQADADEGTAETFVSRGEALYEAQCSNCHGGAGAGAVAADFALTVNGEFVDQVDWRAPELSTVMLRYSREEVTQILNLGRPGTPMPAWGEPGGGPLTPQQIDNIVDYLDSIKPYDVDDFGDPAEIDEDGNVVVYEEGDDIPEGKAVGDPVVPVAWVERQDAIDNEVERTTCTGEFAADAECVPQYDSRGEALFNIGRVSGWAAGAYSCARCHTARWSYAYPGSSAFSETDNIPALTAAPGPSGGGGYAANLWDIDRKFGLAVAANGGPLELAVDEMGHPRSLPDGSLVTVMFEAPVVDDPDGPYLARDEFGELLPVEDGQVVDGDGEPVTEIDGDPVEIVDRVALDAEGGALLDGDQLADPGRSEPFSASQLDFIQRGGQEGQAYGDLVVSNGGAQMPAFGLMFTAADIAEIVAYERQLTALDARTEWVDPITGEVRRSVTDVGVGTSWVDPITGGGDPGGGDGSPPVDDSEEASP